MDWVWQRVPCYDQVIEQKIAYLCIFRIWWARRCQGPDCQNKVNFETLTAINNARDNANAEFPLQNKSI